MEDQTQFEIIPWNENFETAIPLVDEQHRRLVGLINILASYLSLGSDANHLNDVLNELAAYADYHFKTEESIWQPAFKDDNWFVDHKRIHDSFLPKVLEIKKENQGGTLEKSLEEILKFLVNWLVYHIIDSDRRMAKVLQALDEGLSLEEAKQSSNLQMSGLMQTLIDTVLGMYEQIASRSMALIKEKDERIRAQQALIASEMQKQAMDSMISSMEKIIGAMATTIEMRSPYTAGHQRRAAALVEAISIELGLSENEIHGNYLAAMIHDIGEVKIPAELISRPGKLSDIESKIVRQHSQAGHDILKDIDFPWPIAQIILQHHERLDGSGYPNGLKGDQIIMGARILAVADVVEAMSSHRPYRPSMSLEKVFEEINSKKGICYDATVVDACTKLFLEKKFAFAA